jgi:hypothetical protein
LGVQSKIFSPHKQDIKQNDTFNVLKSKKEFGAKVKATSSWQSTFFCSKWGSIIILKQNTFFEIFKEVGNFKKNIF